MKRFILVETKPVNEQALPYVRELGFSPVLFTRLEQINPEVYRNVGREKFDDVIDVDTHDPAAMHALIERSNMEVAGILGCEDDVMVAAARLAERLSLPHPALAGLENTHHKDTVRDILARAGVPQPRYAVIDLEALPERPPLPFPFVLKPVRDAGALGVSFCRSQAEYDGAIREVTQARRSRTGLPRTKFLLEEFIDGTFYGAEFLWHQDQWKILGVNRIFVDGGDSLCMTGLSHPSDLSKPVLDAVGSELLNWLRILELQGSAVNVEFKLVGGRPILIEVNPRIAGARVYKQIEMTSGIAPLKHMIRQACGLAEEPLVESAPTKAYVAEAYIFARHAGTICDADTSKVDGGDVLEYNFRKFPFVLDDSQTTFETMIGYALASGNDCLDAMRKAADIAAKIEFVYR